jgi:hypothetical protein
VSGTSNFGTIATGVWNGTTIAIANGGTNKTSYTSGSVVYYDGTSLTEDNANLFWDKTNHRLGIGTTGPGFPLDVKTGANTALRLIGGQAATNNNVQLRFQGIVAGADQWAIGNAIATNDNSRNFDIFDLVASRACFRVDASGHVGIGLTTMTHQLQVGTDDASKPTTNTWTVTSDRRTKDQIEPYTSGAAVLRRLRAKTFVFNGLAGTEAGVRGVGFIAQDLARIAPEMVTKTRGKLRVSDKRETVIYAYQGHNLPFLLLNGWQDHDARIAALEGKPHA